MTAACGSLRLQKSYEFGSNIQTPGARYARVWADIQPAPTHRCQLTVDSDGFAGNPAIRQSFDETSLLRGRRLRPEIAHAKLNLLWRSLGGEPERVSDTGVGEHDDAT